MQNILLVRNLGFLSIFIVLFFRLFNCKVYVYKTSLVATKNFCFKLLSIEECSFEKCPVLDSRAIFGHEGDNIDNVVDDFIEQNTVIVFNQFFTNIKDSKFKLRLLIKNYVLHACQDLDRISIWINGNFNNDSGVNTKVYFLGATCRLSKKFLLKECNKIKIIPILSSNLYFFIKSVARVSNFCLKKFLNLLKKFKIEKKDNNLFSIMGGGLDTSLYEVLFFPHQSIFYSQLYVKNYFYSKEEDSVFHQSKILHVEFSNIQLAEKQVQFYYDNDIKTFLFPRLKITNQLSNLIHIVKMIGFINILGLLRRNFMLTIVLLMNSVKFISSRDNIKKLFHAKLVLVGYELNFPPIISLAFESLKVKTIAAQERFLPTAFYSNFGFIVDSYFCSSEFVKDKLNRSRSKFVNNAIPSGQVRTDLLVNFQKNSKIFNKNFTIVAFDYHSVYDIDTNQKEPLINWKANLSFYSDLCRLAENIQNIKIIIRGKDDHLNKNLYLREILNRINKIPNILIDNNFEKPYLQYEISSQADLIIAKHTSICDELIAIGKKVIFHDYLPNSSYVIKQEFNYNNANIFANSYKDLESMVKNILGQNNLISDKKMLELKTIVNNGPADGLVRERIMNQLNLLYKESKAVNHI